MTNPESSRMYESFSSRSKLDAPTNAMGCVRRRVVVARLWFVRTLSESAGTNAGLSIGSMGSTGAEDHGYWAIWDTKRPSQL